MKFRIIEIKKPMTIPYFIPEYKELFFWYKISSSKFVGSIFDNIEFEQPYFTGTYSYKKAEKIVNKFKKWFKSNTKYKIIHDL